ncbi:MULTISPECIES: penicillin-binding protein 2 [Acidithiobacillus]|uniref:peptidoglycan D,D-transpeptidase FtsI family protein n=1 Tax=Acidithiobacillus TaxID=119977 RepID=UPI001C07118F|nr:MULTISPECIES: penicillin-binding protein 2 [Acidithiobacillus]MBU2847684.1 penicillin-binding protein 2 [Acidithiobacillus ferriphilus]MDA8245242.1 penicillin-binding protein 2 [Acidithiobacillus sp.]
MPPERLSLQRILPRWRATLLLIVILLGLVMVLTRDAELQWWRAHDLRAQGRMRYLQTRPLPADRGAIYGSNGDALAANVPAVTIWTDPRLFDAHRKDWDKVAQVLGLSPETLAARVRSGGSGFAYILRQVQPQLGKSLDALHVPGIYVQKTSRTYYPLGAVTTPLLGLVHLDHQGAAGLEMGYNQWLSGKAGSEKVLVDGQGEVLHIVGARQTPAPGRDLHLTINPQIQYWAYMTLLAAQKHFGATEGSAVVMNAQTGQILAMASVPSCNPNARAGCGDPSDYVNNAVHQAFEPGSVMKPFMVAAALATGSIQPDQSFNVSRCLPVGGFCIRDDVVHHELNVAHILKYSSDIGAAKIALRTPAQAIYDMYLAAGYGQEPNLGFAGATGGVLPQPQTWDKARHATIALGYGVSVTTLQLADGYAAIANGGYHVTPTLIAGQLGPRVRIMSAGIAAHLRHWLEGVCAANGTGVLAAIPGYAVAGKTGTANMANGKDGFLKNKTNATFVGFAPGFAPKLVMAVTLRGSSRYWNFGGVESAPVFRVTMRHALEELNIAPRWCGGKACASKHNHITTTQAEIWAEGGGK